jgi:hypothetical protein
MQTQIKALVKKRADQRSSIKTGSTITGTGSNTTTQTNTNMGSNIRTSG